MIHPSHQTHVFPLPVMNRLRITCSVPNDSRSPVYRRPPSCIFLCLLPHCSVSRIGSPAITAVLWFPPSSPNCKMSPLAPTLLFRIFFFFPQPRHSASPFASLLRPDCLSNVVKMAWPVALSQIALYRAAAGLCVYCITGRPAAASM